jgi:IS30 family transposase
MTKQYNHLNQEERELIAQDCYEGKSISFIAKALGRNKSSISRELSRNASTEYKRYTPCRAHTRAELGNGSPTATTSGGKNPA